MSTETEFVEWPKQWVECLETERDRLREQNASLLAALEAQELLGRNTIPTPFGHDCHWCADCVQKVRDMRRAAIKGAKS